MTTDESQQDTSAQILTLNDSWLGFKAANVPFTFSDRNLEAYNVFFFLYYNDYKNRCNIKCHSVVVHKLIQDAGSYQHLICNHLLQIHRGTVVWGIRYHVKTLDQN